MKSPSRRAVRSSAVFLFTLCLCLLSEPSFAQPAITTHIPGQNALHVAADTTIAVQFSEAIDGSTVGEDTFNVDGAMTGEIAGAFSGGGTDTITFDPSADFAPGEVVTVTLASGMKNTDGDALAVPYRWQFTVEAEGDFGAFGPPQDISTNANGASSVYAADLDGDGAMDALCVSWQDEKIAWYENKPRAIMAPIIMLILDDQARGFGGR